MKKKLAVFLCLCMALGMIGCAGNSSSVDTEKNDKEKKKHNVEETENVDKDNILADSQNNGAEEPEKDIFDVHYNSRIYGEHVLLENDDFVITATDGFYAHKEFYGRVDMRLPIQIDLKDGFDKKLRISADIINVNDIELVCEMQNVYCDMDPSVESSRTTFVDVDTISQTTYYDIFGEADVVKVGLHLIISADNGNYSYDGWCNVLLADDYTVNTPFADNMKLVYSSQNKDIYYSGILSVYQKEDVRILFATSIKDIGSEYTHADIETEYKIYADGEEFALSRNSMLRVIRNNTIGAFSFKLSEEDFNQLKNAHEVKLILTETSCKYVRRIINDPLELDVPVIDPIEIDITEDIKNYQYYLDE